MWLPSKLIKQLNLELAKIVPYSRKFLQYAYVFQGRVIDQDFRG